MNNTENWPVHVCKVVQMNREGAGLCE